MHTLICVFVGATRLDLQAHTHMPNNRLINQMVGGWVVGILGFLPTFLILTIIIAVTITHHHHHRNRMSNERPSRSF